MTVNRHSKASQLDESSVQVAKPQDEQDERGPKAPKRKKKLGAVRQLTTDAQAHGESTDDRIVRKVIAKVYSDHLDSLKNICTVDHNTICTMQDRLFEWGLSFSKVKSTATESQNNRSGIILITDIVRAQLLTKVRRTTPPAELQASDDEANSKTSANGVQPSGDESSNDAGESRAQLAPTKSPAWSMSTKSVWAWLSTKVRCMVPPAELLTSSDDKRGDDAGES
ncbi:hypothetical protein FRC10_012234 [Ceratobasidium sp. 414]|nr:hypothetical protein FRC10_012234 [Ceratobasidium sp. 414]